MRGSGANLVDVAKYPNGGNEFGLVLSRDWPFPVVEPGYRVREDEVLRDGPVATAANFPIAFSRPAMLSSTSPSSVR